MKRILGITSLLVFAACAPAPRQVVMTPEFLAHAPRYRLVSPQGPQAEPVERLALAVQEELAQRGMLLAAPWETPTLQVSIASTEGIQSYQGVGPVITTVADRSCAGSDFDLGHCTALDGPALIPAAPPSQEVWNVSLRIQQLPGGKLLFDRRGIAPRSSRDVPMYQLRLLTKQILGGFTP